MQTDPPGTLARAATPANPNEPPAVQAARQPLAVWVLAFAAMVSFMGIGLVDPILKSIAANLDATPSQVSLLFTSYLLVTAVAMLVTSFVSSRFGGRTTLMIGLGVIIVFSALAGTSDSVAALVGWRAGWGLGNALFIATALAAIIAVARGGAEKAVTLYEAALGVGLSIGPLVGAVLGSVNWRAPFFGVAVLMGIALLAISLFLKDRVRMEQRVRRPIRSAPSATAGCSFSGSLPCSTTAGSSPYWRSPRSPFRTARSGSASCSSGGACCSASAPSGERRGCTADSA